MSTGLAMPDPSPMTNEHNHTVDIVVLSSNVVSTYMPIVNTVIESKGPFVAKKEVRIESAVPEDLTLDADPFLIHLALSNLLQNALEFSPVGGTIRVHAAREGDSIALCVDDTGPGIPAFAKEKVFERFFSLERPDTGRKSTGLGLNFVKEIAHLHHGHIILENLPDRGLRASLRLPV